MAMDYTQRAAWASDTVNQELVKLAMLDYAATVQEESAESVGAALHTLRADFAARVTAEPDYWKPKVAANIARELADDTPDDAELLTAVTAAWNRLSAVPGAA